MCSSDLSAKLDTPIPGDVLAIGEVALSGDVRPVPHLARRVAEARRLGFKRILVPAGSRDRVDGVRELRHLEAGIEALTRIANEGR